MKCYASDYCQKDKSSCNGTDLSSMRLAKICSLLGLSMDYVMGLKQEDN